MTDIINKNICMIFMHIMQVLQDSQKINVDYSTYNMQLQC